MRTDSLDLSEDSGIRAATRSLPAPRSTALTAPRPPVAGGGTARPGVVADRRPPRFAPPVVRREPVRPPAVRPDVQGLRAVAVGLVVLYHLRPEELTGGFIGVDVFFVISGFLIVGSLGREAARTGTISLRAFFARRVRRLLPASTAVLVLTTAATLALMPVARWETTAEGVLASVLQVQNWWQAASSGYAEAAAATSPVQHYWSLAVEEQFYVVAPLLLLLACRLAARVRRAPGPVVVAVMSAVVVLSFAHSVLLSQSHHEVAYFATTTRMWELGCGGLLALVSARCELPGRVRSAATWLGLLAICYAAFTFHTGMAFPGWVAAVPVLGTVLVILGGQPASDGAAAHDGVGQRLLGLRPMTFVGDISYSLYLWHWPVIVFWVFWVNRTPTKEECVALLLVSVTLAYLTTRFVETPLRHPRTEPSRALGRRRRGAFRLALVLTTVSLVAAGGPLAYLQYRAQTLDSQRLDAEHPGAATVLPERIPSSEGISLIPDPATAGEDQSIVRGDGCQAFDLRRMSLDQCVFGDVGSPLTIALTGDSHAGQFSTPLDVVGRAKGWRLQTIVRNGCPFTAAAKIVNGEEDAICAEHNEMALAALLEARPQAVVTSAMKPQGYADFLGQGWTSPEALVDGYRRQWQPLVDAGIRVVVIRDTPIPDYLAPECAETRGALSDECSMTRDEAEAQPDPLVEAARGMDGVRIVDLTAYLCNTQVCPSVIGNVLVYRDRSHISDTLALSLAPGLAEALEGKV